MSKKLTWGIAFIISLGILLTIYAAMNFELLSFEWNEKEKLVLHEGFGNSITVTNHDVTIDYDSLEILEQQMGAFNRLIFIGILLASLFIATYWVLLSDKWQENEKKRKKYMLWTLSLNGITIAAAVFIVLRYYHQMNETYHNVLF
ncbi:hypothetical protein [Rossellomorea aquimaris]|uniref:Uncharacterized protein n=2 Tax=Rossellomorea TaxID=2837508 RepID=A0A5D4TL16_9BACI|nr:hypothetical protein [Rossellomorea aquimaris]TYS75481.1 hypothetical protein FZC80_16935 [Rossellomorea aquimaris]